jgi:hypothetical protein
LAEEIRKNYGSDFDRVIMGSNFGDHILSIKEKKFKESGGFFEKGAAEMFSLHMKRGSWQSLDEPASMIISESAARACFGNENPINKIITSMISHRSSNWGVWFP